MPLHMDFLAIFGNTQRRLRSAHPSCIEKLTVTTHRKRNISNAVRPINMHQENQQFRHRKPTKSLLVNIPTKGNLSGEELCRSTGLSCLGVARRAKTEVPIKCTVISGLKSRAPITINSNLSVTTNTDNTSIFNCLINNHERILTLSWGVV